MPPLSLDLDSPATGEMKTICEIDPSDSNRFLYGCALPGWSNHESYAFADLPLLLNRPGPPFYAVGKHREDIQKSRICRINPHDKSLFIYQGWDGTLTSYPIADIPSLITSTGAPFYIPLKNKTSLKPIPGFEGSSFCREGHHSADMGCKHRDRSISASSCDEADDYSDFRANLNRASFRSLERMLGLPPTDFAYDSPHFADEPDGFEGFQNFPASPGTSACEPIPEVQEASFTGDDSFEISFQYPDDIISASQPDEIDGFVGCSRPLSRCRNYGDCMLQASARTSERSLGLPATVVLDPAQPVSKSDSFEDPPFFPAVYGCFGSKHSIPTVSSGSDRHQHTPHRRNNGRHPIGYHIPRPDRILSTDESMSSYFRTHNASRIDNDAGLHRHHSNLSHEQSEKEIKPLSYRFCIDLSNTGSWPPSPEEKEALLASARCSRTLRALLPPRAPGQKPTAANGGHARYGFHKNILEAHGDPVKTHHAHHDTGFFGSMDMQGDCGMFAAPVKHGTYQRADLDERFRDCGFKARYEMASCGDDVEKGHNTFLDKGAYDAKYNPSYRRKNRFIAKRMTGKKIRSMIFFIVVAIFGLGMWFDSMHVTDLVDRGEGKVEFGGGERDGVWGLRDEGEGVEVFPQLDPAAPDLGELGGGGASGGKE